MTTIEERLKEIAEIDLKIEAITAYKEKKEAIEENKSLIEELRDELKMKNTLVASVDPELLEMMSQSASRSRGSRGEDETIEIATEVTEATERMQRLIMR